MVGKVQKKREALRDLLIDLAEKRVKAGGISQIKARDLAQEAGCAVGAIYNVFGDLNELVMAVNGRTFRRLGAHVTDAVSERGNEESTQTLVTMAHAYLDFATTNTLAWRTLFDLEMSTEQSVPDWYLAELAKVMALISAPLARVYPDMPAPQVELMTRALFSSVHGIVLLGLEKRISAVPTEQLEEMIELVLNNITGKHTAS